MKVAVAAADGSVGATTVVACDVLGARTGEVVLVASSTRVRDRVLGPGHPVKSVVIAIVDEIHGISRRVDGGTAGPEVDAAELFRDVEAEPRPSSSRGRLLLRNSARLKGHCGRMAQKGLGDGPDGAACTPKGAV